MSLERLVYFSTNVPVRGDAVAASLKRILNSSIRNNVAAGITGGLLFNRNYFVQVLEGERSGLSPIFTHISVDPRHQDVVLVDQKPVNRRVFGAWSMGFAGRTELFDQMLDRFCPSGRFDPRDMTADQLTAFTLELVSKENGMVSAPHSELVKSAS
jgi:Sensors of blue-light using FAD